MKRQALYACNTCTPKGGEPAGMCLACSYTCHEGHELFELYTKRLVNMELYTVEVKYVVCLNDNIIFRFLYYRIVLLHWNNCTLIFLYNVMIQIFIYIHIMFCCEFRGA